MALAAELQMDAGSLRRWFNKLEFSNFRVQELKTIVDYLNENMRRGKPRLVKTGAWRHCSAPAPRLSTDALRAGSKATLVELLTRMTYGQLS